MSKKIAKNKLEVVIEVHNHLEDKTAFWEELKEIFELKKIHKSTQYYFQTCFDTNTIAGPLNFFGVKKTCQFLSTFEQLFGLRVCLILIN
ncbi:MAG: hypothetical protein GY810_07685 [Aureispira sp.]|nr:hypothetical protein [Aureispira sp.]